MFVTEALGSDAAQLTPDAVARLAKLEQLCPGDFAAVKRQVEILAAQLTAEEFLEQLEAEHRIKPEVREARISASCTEPRVVPLARRRAAGPREDDD
jgi:hypothetical protein